MAVMGLESGGLGVKSCLDANGCRVVVVVDGGELCHSTRSWGPPALAPRLGAHRGTKSQDESSAHLESILSPNQPQT